MKFEGISPITEIAKAWSRTKIECHIQVQQSMQLHHYTTVHRRSDWWGVACKSFGNHGADVFNRWEICRTCWPEPNMFCIKECQDITGNMRTSLSCWNIKTQRPWRQAEMRSVTNQKCNGSSSRTRGDWDVCLIASIPSELVTGPITISNASWQSAFSTMSPNTDAAIMVLYT